MARRGRLAGVALFVSLGLLAPLVGAQAPEPPSVSSDLGAAKVYPIYPYLTAEMQSLAADHKDIARLHSAGQSGKGMELWYMEVADFEAASRVPIHEREVLYIDGGTHANEYIGVIFVMQWLRTLLAGYGSNATATWVVENRHTIILPLVNPEGSMNGVGRLNDNRVNINRNYPIGWGDVVEDPALNYGGPYPASEPETRAVIGVWERFDPDFILSIHCCGNLWLYPYGIEGREPHPDDKAVFEKICNDVLYDVRKDCGPTWSTIYPASGITSDSGYALVGANSWSYEMKSTTFDGEPSEVPQGVWGPPAYTAPIEELQKESWRAVEHAFLNVHLYGGHAEASIVSVATDAVTLEVRNTGFGNLTNAKITVGDALGNLRSNLIPRLGAGESATIVVAGAFRAGAFPVTLSYQKRPIDTKMGASKLQLGVTGGGDALVGVLDHGSPIAVTGAAALEIGSQTPSRVPGFEAWIVVGALAAVSFSRRKR
ncbi:MAG: succinylglutamate desuccinylase/aspartoacylase family protein [Euryarchaeota archaeon]|nr:succinylglutamate desuccinylase/aspartoacylase family protein [Euryarchaeota archaeon]